MIVPYAINSGIHDSELQVGDILIDSMGRKDPIDPDRDYVSFLVLGYVKASKILYVMYDNSLIKTYRDDYPWETWFIIR